MEDSLQKQKCVNTSKQREQLEQKTVADKVTKSRPCVGLPHVSFHDDSSNKILKPPFAGILPAVNPAEDPVPTMHKESAVCDPKGEQEPVSVLPPQEMHRRRHEPGW